MIGRLAFLAARLIACAIFLLTWAYGVTTRSAFAFDMFIKPQLSPAIASFVTWHPAIFGAAYLLGALTLVPIIRTPAASAPQRIARIAAAAYIVVFGGVTVWLTGQPYLASLGGGGNHLLVVPGALLPILCLAAIDHLASPLVEPRPHGTVLTQHTLLRAAVASAVVIWAAHVTWSWLSIPPGRGMAAAAAGAGWSLLFDLAVAQVAYLSLAFASTISPRGNRRVEYGLVVLLVALAIGEFFRRIVLPPLAFTDVDRAIVALPFGVAIAAMWSGLRVSGRARMQDGAFALFATTTARPAKRIALIVVTLAAAIYLTTQIERLDWAFILRQTIAVGEAFTVFALILPLAARGSRSDWRMARLVAPPLAVLAALHAARLAPPPADSLRSALDPQAAVERAIAMDPLARVASSAFVSRQPVDSAFFRTLLDNEASLWAATPVVPGDALIPIAKPASAPNVFVIVIDSLRRDYLSPYNPAVTFTPAVDQWARASFVFKNAFTPYGGTAQAMPSLWAGRSVPRSWKWIMKDINNLEHLIVSTGFDFLINDHTVREHLKDSTQRTFLNPFVASVNTDLCQNVESLITHLRTRTSRQPVFTFLAPMNVHVLNTMGGRATKPYPGFYAPTAMELERTDTCFGNFIAFLKGAGMFDNSIIVLTSDHGDSLGEENRWGHQNYLFPEIVRIPLIISVPAALRSRLTTDLSRVAFLPDITPTLTSLVTGQARDGDLPDGGVLLVPSEQQFRSRRRRAFMLMSSYGPAFGVLRKNGREMYMTDLRDWQEHAFELGPVWYDEVPVTAAARSASHATLLENVEAVRRLYLNRP
jgi:hypothetical protein